MAVWKSFIDLVHLIGALGCLALTGGFAAEGQVPRAVFYALCTMAFAVALARRWPAHQAQRPVVVAPRPVVAQRPVVAPRPVVVDLRDGVPARAVHRR